MPKKKKTLKQKLKTEQRHQVSTLDRNSEEASSVENHASSESVGQTFSLPQSYLNSRQSGKRNTSQTSVQTTAIETHEYKYLGMDLLKTFLLTSSIVIVELILRFVFERG